MIRQPGELEIELKIGRLPGNLGELTCVPGVGQREKVGGLFSVVAKFITLDDVIKLQFF